jgi:hypothetical protein
MTDFAELNGIPVYCVPAEGPSISTGKDAVDLISSASEHRAALIAIPVERLGDDFFELRTGVAGEIAQKFVIYQVRVAIIGGISNRTAVSKSLAAFVLESNRGEDLWFVELLEGLERRLIDVK